jgi:pimeloyl-ACP methyl ester carboxylesterase
MRLFVSFILSITLLSAVTAQQYSTPQELADENGHFATVDQASIYYVTAGDPTNPAVIFIHGFGGSTFTWRDNLLPVAQAGFYAIALDLPPFGLSDKSASLGYTRSDMAKYVVGLMDILQIDHATIVGHSMGGAVTALLAVNNPERVQSLVFVAGGVFEALDRETTQETDNQSPFAFLANLDPTSPGAAQLLRVTLRPRTFANIMTSAYYDQESITDEMVDGYARPLQIENWPQGFLAYLQARDQQIITLSDLANTATMPVLILWGEEDSWVPITLGEAMLATLPDARMIRYPLTGHLPMEEQTERFNQDLVAFLEENNN